MSVVEVRPLNVAFHSMKSSGVGHSRGKRILLGFGASDVSRAGSIVLPSHRVSCERK